MFVVVVGSREWRGIEATQRVNELLDGLRERYAGMVVLTSSTDKGVGTMVRDRCLHDRHSFQMTDINLRIFAQLPRGKLIQLFRARNKALQEAGEEFHFFVDSNRKGAFEDLIEDLRTASEPRPYWLHFPDGHSERGDTLYPGILTKETTQL
jgi:hypothetical protein